MAGVIPVSLGLTIWQLITQKGIRLDLLASRERIDGTVVEQLGGLDYIRAANTHQLEAQRVRQAAQYKRARELRHHFEMSLFGSGKAINEGFFHVVVLAFAIYLLVHGQLRAGDVLTFSVLYLSVMAPLNEIHRFIDEAHESSLRMGDLLGLLAEPVDRSFEATADREPRVVVGEPLFVTKELRVEYRGANDVPKSALNGLSSSIHHGKRLAWPGDLAAVNHMASYAHAPGECERRRRNPGGRRVGKRIAAGHWRAGRVRGPEPLRLRRHDRREHRLRLRSGDARSDSPCRRTCVHP